MSQAPEVWQMSDSLHVYYSIISRGTVLLYSIILCIRLPARSISRSLGATATAVAFSHDGATGDNFIIKLKREKRKDLKFQIGQNATELNKTERRAKQSE